MDIHFFFIKIYFSLTSKVTEGHMYLKELNIYLFLLYQVYLVNIRKNRLNSNKYTLRIFNCTTANGIPNDKFIKFSV